MNLASNRSGRNNNRKIFAFTLMAMAMAFAGCSPSRPASPLPGDRSAAIALLQRINASAQSCWVKSGDADFRSYRVIPELDTRTGTPRILVVGAKAAQGLPQLVIEARGTPARLSAYGPLASGPLSPRISADVNRWAGGDAACA